MPPIGILIKPSSSKCNLRCKYCFYHSVAENRETGDFGLMSEEVIEKIIKKTLAFADGYATISFQGGEPMLRGLDFFKKVIEYEEKWNIKNVRIQNCIQTNGWFIDEEWAAFFHENRFLVGISIDGPEAVHNKYRVDADGKGTFARIMQSVETMNKYSVDFNVLFVVTRDCADYPDKIYRFFRRRDFRFLQFIPCIEPIGMENSGTYSLTEESYGKFLERMFQLWSADLLSGKEISIRYFDNVIRMAMGMPPETCSMMGACQCQFVFEADGSVYPCDFYTTDRWKIGNILENELLEMKESTACREFLDSSPADHSEDCRNCRWWGICRGGCRRDRDYELTGESGRNRYCNAYWYFFEHCARDIKRTAEAVSKMNRMNG